MVGKKRDNQKSGKRVDLADLLFENELTDEKLAEITGGLQRKSRYGTETSSGHNKTSLFDKISDDPLVKPGKDRKN